MSSFNMPGADKFMSKMFRKVDGCVWDLMSGKIGVQTDDGIATLEGEGDDARVSINMFDEFGIALPAFAQSTPVDSVKVGDIIYSGKSRITWVVGVNANGTFKVMKSNGESTTWTPPKVSMLGLDSGVMVLRSLMNMLPNGAAGLSSVQNSLLPLMMMGGGDSDGLEKMMPLLLMGQMGGTDLGGTGMNQMFQTMMLMKMMGGDSGYAGLKTNKGGPFSQ